MGKEAKSRVKINKLLEDADWRFFDNARGKANIRLENHTKITKQIIDAFGEDFEKTANGYIDYLLLDSKGYPLIVLEAKCSEINPLDAKEQARRYAQSQNCRFIILSNGNIHYLWDIKTGNPQLITQFPTQQSFEHHTKFVPNPESLLREPVAEDYILLTQRPDYATDPQWLDESKRRAYLEINQLKLLRPYQVRAVQRIQEVVQKEQKTRFLFEMATGTGKTLVAAAVIKLFLRTRNASRVLFLVDRLELEDQAFKNFVRYLKNDFTTLVYKQNRDDWRKAEIVVTTVQSLLVNNKYKSLFSPTDFDLLISDETHRSINGNSRAVFEYFVGYKLGLTATPKDYLKNIENIRERDPREVERRILLDTYRTFGCEDHIPTFRFSLLDGVPDYLVSPTVVDARTEITTQLLSDQGYSVMVEDEDGNEVEAIFTHRDFERKFMSDQTNKIFCKTFLENAKADPISGEIGKTICFCVSQDHAAKITQILNEMAHKLWPGRYNSDFAVQVTSRIPDAQQYAINFSNNNLNQHSRFQPQLEGYKTSKTRVCVTVGMMTTGYDCEDLLNLCLMRPIFSPQDFVQMKGRGTRKFTFQYRQPNGKQVDMEKDTFKLFDFFAVCEYFEKDYNYDQVIPLPPTNSGGGGGGGGGGQPDPDYENLDPDPLKTLAVTAVGVQGMRVDREMFGKFEQQIKEDAFVAEKVEQGDFDAAEDYIRQNVFDKPKEFYNIEKLRRALSLDRRVTLREIVEKVFGLIPGFKNREELLEDECDKFVSIYKPDSDTVLPMKNFLKAYASDPEIRQIIEKQEYGRLFTTSIGEDFKKLSSEMRRQIPEYVKDYVPMNRFL